MLCATINVSTNLSTTVPTSRSEETERRSIDVAEHVVPVAHEPYLWQSPRVVKQIGALAKRWSLDQPDLREDLFQEGWLAAWQEEQDHPDAPPAHLVRVASERMRWWRRLGHSVDGKPNAAHDRPMVYRVDSLDQRVRSEDGRPCSLHEIIPSRQRDLASHVQGYLHGAAFIATLPIIDQRILGLRLAGYRWCEVTQMIPLNPRALHARRHALQADATRHWDLD